MLRNVIAMLLLVLGLFIVFGCNSQAGFTPTQNLRRVMIAGEQMRLVGEDFQREVDLEEYPQRGRWNY